MTFELEAEALDTLEMLGELDQEVLYSIISDIHSWVHGVGCNHMECWDNPELIGWFMQTYDFNPVSKSWNLKVTIH